MSAEFTAPVRLVEPLIKAVLPHTSDDGFYPMITCVRLDLDGHRLMAVGTDRFTLAIARGDLRDFASDAEPVEPIAVCVFATDLKRLLTFFRTQRTEPATWVVTAESVTVSVGLESLTIRTVETEFVKWRSVLDTISKQERGNADLVAFAPSRVESFVKSAKALNATHDQMRWHLGAGPKGAPIVTIGDHFVGVLMPMVVPEEERQLDLSAALGDDTVKAITASAAGEAA